MLRGVCVEWCLRVPAVDQGEAEDSALLLGAQLVHALEEPGGGGRGWGVGGGVRGRVGVRR